MKLAVLLEDERYTPNFIDFLISEFEDLGYKADAKHGIGLTADHDFRVLWVSKKDNPHIIANIGTHVLYFSNVKEIIINISKDDKIIDSFAVPWDPYKQGNTEDLIKTVCDRLDNQDVPKPMKVDGPVPSDNRHVYHITNLENALQIAKQGLLTHSPSYGTDQETWPDGTSGRRSYWMNSAEHIWQFAPDEGQAVLLRARLDHNFEIEHTTNDYYATDTIWPHLIDIYCEDGKWHSLV